MHLAQQVIQWAVEQTPTPAPVPPPSGGGFVDGFTKIIGSLTGLFAAAGTFIGAGVTYISARQIRKLNVAQRQAQQSQDPSSGPPPGPGGTP